MQPAFSPDEIDQLQRAAQMFEMILDTGAQSDEAYETLKDVYDKLRLPDEYRRVTARFADYLLARDDRDGGIAQFTELAQRYPDEVEWPTRLAELGAPVPGDEEALADPSEQVCSEPAPVADTSTTRNSPNAADGLVDREAVRAFNKLKTVAERHARDRICAADGEELDRAIDEAEKILSELDQPDLDAAPAEAVEAVEVDEAPAETDEAVEVEASEAPVEVVEVDEAPVETDEAVEVDEAPAETDEAVEVEASEAPVEVVEVDEAPAETDEAVEAEASEAPVEPETAPVVVGSAAPAPETASESASAERVVPVAAAHLTGDLQKEFHRSLRLGEMMVERGVITRDNLDTALEQQRRESSKQIGQVLIELGYATEADVLNCLALQAGVPYLPLALYEVQPELATLLPEEFARKNRVVPVDAIAKNLLITIAAPLSTDAKAELESLLGDRKANYYISEQSEIEKKLDELYPHP